MTLFLLIAAGALMTLLCGFLLGYFHALRVTMKRWGDRQEDWIRHRAERAARAIRRRGGCSKEEATGIIAHEMLGR